jgi:hypothetical protein
MQADSSCRLSIVVALVWCQQPQWCASQSQFIDFCVHVLQVCEEYWRLSSYTPMVRIDIGAEFVHCHDHGGCTEAELRGGQKRPHQWQTTNAGFIVRFFVRHVSRDRRVVMELPIRVESNSVRSFSLCVLSSSCVCQVKTYPELYGEVVASSHMEYQASAAMAQLLVREVETRQRERTLKSDA